MILSARMLSDAQTVNSFKYVPILQAMQGDAYTVYFQLIDASQDLARDGFFPAGRRYIPASGATLTVTLDSIDAAKAITRIASQPTGFTQDASIWSVSVLATDTIRGTVPLRLTLTEGTKVTRGVLMPALAILPKDATFTFFQPGSV